MNKDPIKRRTWSIVIHGHRWNIFVMSDAQIQAEWAEDNELVKKIKEVDGFTEFSRYRIVVNDRLYGRPRFMETLFHEIVHAIVNDLTQMGEYNEELIAEMIGREMPNIFRQCKTIPKGWWECP